VVRAALPGIALTLCLVVLLVAGTVRVVASVVQVVLPRSLAHPLEFVLEVCRREDGVRALGRMILWGVGNIRRSSSCSASMAMIAGSIWIAGTGRGTLGHLRAWLAS